MSSNLVNITEAERKLADRVNPAVTGNLALTSQTGGLAFTNAGEAMEFAKLMALSQIGVRKHLRGNPGACLAIVVQAVEWRMSPYAVANKSYNVNDQIAYESQLIQAVILQRAPIKGRFKVKYEGEGERRVCTVSATLSDGDSVDYRSPEFGKITPKNSPLWKSDPDQQQFYYSARALCRRHFPDVLLGVYAEDEIERDPERARDVTPKPRTLAGRLDALAAEGAGQVEDVAHDPETGEVHPDHEDSGEAPPSAPAEDAGAASPSHAPASAPDDDFPGDRPMRSQAAQKVFDAAMAKARRGSETLRRHLRTINEADEALLGEAEHDALGDAAAQADAAAAGQG